MTTNPFTDWPLWFYFGHHVQNAPLIDNELRNLNPGPKPIPFTALIDRSNGGSPSGFDVNTLPSPDAAAKLVNAINRSIYYDYVNDMSSFGANLDPNRLWIATPASFNLTTIQSIPSDALVIIKGIAREGNGGDIMPIIASPTNMRYIFQALGPAQAIARGETGVTRFDVMSALSQPERERLLGVPDSKDSSRVIGGLLQRPLYQNPTIQLIRQSFKRQSSAPSDLERSATRIRGQLAKVIPEEKAINVASGSLVNATASCYNVMEVQVVPPGLNEYRIVKFAFKTSMKDDDRQAYETLLRERFKARPVQSAESSVEQRKAIFIQPIRASSNDYPNIFKPSDGFQVYIRSVNNAVNTQIVDVTQTLHGEIETYDEEDVEDFIDESGEDIDNY